MESVAAAPVPDDTPQSPPKPNNPKKRGNQNHRGKKNLGNNQFAKIDDETWKNACNSIGWVQNEQSEQNQNTTYQTVSCLKSIFKRILLTISTSNRQNRHWNCKSRTWSHLCSGWTKLTRQKSKNGKNLTIKIILFCQSDQRWVQWKKSQQQLFWKCRKPWIILSKKSSKVSRFFFLWRNYGD